MMSPRSILAKDLLGVRNGGQAAVDAGGQSLELAVRGAASCHELSIEPLNTLC